MGQAVSASQGPQSETVTQQAHSELIRDIIAEFSHGDTRLFVANTGVAWQGNLISKTHDRIVLAHPRPVHFGAVGMSDIIGLSAGGIYTAIECKTGKARPTTDQASFLDMVRRLGGRAEIARSVTDADRIIHESATW